MPKDQTSHARPSTPDASSSGGMCVTVPLRARALSARRAAAGPGAPRPPTRRPGTALVQALDVM